MKNTHTPGPCIDIVKVLDRLRFEVNRPQKNTLIDQAIEEVNRLQGLLTDATVQVDRQTSLITAMLEALKDCVGRLEAYYGGNYPAVTRGKQAIAQAEGKAS